MRYGVPYCTAEMHRYVQELHLWGLTATALMDCSCMRCRAFRSR